jgi:pimeloyl-ACP methyl ester carboxylesterase
VDVGTLRRIVGGNAVEAAWLLAHSAAYPWGLTRERTRFDRGPTRLDDLPPHIRGLVVGDVEAAGTPIVLVHGFLDNRAIFGPLRRSLRRRGFGRIATHSYGPLTADVSAAAARLGRHIERICDETGFERVHVVGHSLGGVLARYHVQRQGGDVRVHSLITLGSPHLGTLAANAVPTRLARQLRPGSPLLRSLEQPAPGCRTRFTAIYSDLDALVLPNTNARLEHPDLDARNVLVRGVGHLSLPSTPRVVREVVGTLAHLDSDGHTLAAGVSHLHPPAPRPRTPDLPAARELIRQSLSTGA